MDYEKEIKELKIQLTRLNNAFLQSQRNQVPMDGKTDEAYNKVPQVDENTTGVGENQAGLLDVAQLSLISRLRILIVASEGGFISLGKRIVGIVQAA